MSDRDAVTDTPVSAEDLEFDSAVASMVHAQNYSPSPSIEGVRTIPLKRFTEDGGSLQELARLRGGATESVPGFNLAQITFCEVEPDATKAWHVHRHQDDIWFVPPGDRLLVGLWDIRKGSPTQGTKMRLVLGAGKSEMLLIPHGVAHGVANLGTTTGHMIYLLNRQFSAEDTDELRLPWNAVGEDFWRITPG